MATTFHPDPVPAEPIRVGARVLPLPGRAAAPAPHPFRAPPPAPGTVRRAELVGRLLRSAAPLVLASAPAGYGKTTLLAQWAREDPRPVRWVTLDGAHRDPDVLAADVGRALGAARATGGPFLLVLDGADVLDAPAPAAVVAGALADLPPGGQVAIGCRTLPALPLGRLRAERRLLRLGEPDLALAEVDAAALARASGLELTTHEVAALVRRAEGWPAGLSLAALSLSERPGAAGDIAGDDPFVADYLRDELIAPSSPETVEFLVRTSVLDRLSGPLCDALLGRTGSGLVLRELHRTRMLLIPVDRAQEWYRYHGLFADLLCSELRRREPELEPALHGRASRWLEEHGDRDAAIAHARAGGDVARAARLIWSGVPERVGRGPHGAWEGWLEGLGEDDIAASAPLALASAWSALERQDDLVERWLAAAECTPDPAPDLRGAIALLRALVAPAGVGALRDDALVAYRMVPPGSPWRAFACLLAGIGHDLNGDSGRARLALEEGAHRAARHVPCATAACHARLALLALEEGSWDRATALALRAREQAGGAGVRDHVTMGLVAPIAALVLARAGRAQEAKDEIRRAERLVAAIGGVAPWLAVEARILLARASALLGDLARARTLVLEAGRRLPSGEESPVLRQRLEATREAAAVDRAASPASTCSLTAAEVRVLRYLPTHLSFREIAGQLYVSRFTVKSQALAAYRKLGATSRAEAVERARGLGLLGNDAVTGGRAGHRREEDQWPSDPSS
jgi:LuxR family transcriptional regulator, maltose regulon positive regulatory protein